MVNVQTEGFPDCVLETGPADCVGRAEAFELVKDVHASSLERGRQIETRYAHSAGPQDFETSAGWPASVSAFVFVFVSVLRGCVFVC